MRFEIEIKARVADPDAVRSRLEGFARFVREYDKSDRYFLLPGATAGDGRNFRVRSDGAKAFVTWKSRSLEEGLELNLERECAVDDPEALIELFAALGARPYFTKRKIGREYAYGDLCVELSEVPPLGHFIEIECLVEAGPEAAADGADRTGPGIGLHRSPDKGLSEAIRARELEVLGMAGIAESAIEPRTYSAMLALARSGG